MKVEEDSLVSRLKDVLHLTEYEARTYLALIMHGSMTVGELSKLSGVPRAKCYETLRNLVRKGMVVMVSSKPAKYAPLPAEEGIANRMDQLRKELERRLIEAEQLLEEIREVSGQESVREVQMMIIESHEAILSNSVKDAVNAEREVLVALSNKPARIDWSKYVRDLVSCMRKGVKFRFLVPSLSVFSSEFREVLKGDMVEPPSWSVEVKETRAVRIPFLVIDRDITYLYISDPGTNTLRAAVRIRDSRMADQMRELFNRYWEMSR
ncbi:MAG: helix-turn-helix domain-containing protein [Candidatus Korarchaeota archaeon]|nr:helix-turn-helix domain-containing protein [Candidatus Korarchaeota archaeon]